MLQGGSDVVTPGTEAEQRLPFREPVAEITGPGSTRLVLEASAQGLCVVLEDGSAARLRG